MWRHFEHHGYGCCCDWPSFGFRMHFAPGMRFARHRPTREERIAWLEEYLEDLKAEVKAVEERLAEMKGAK